MMTMNEILDALTHRLIARGGDPAASRERAANLIRNWDEVSDAVDERGRVPCASWMDEEVVQLLYEVPEGALQRRRTLSRNRDG